MPDGGKGQFNRIRCPSTLPVPRREIKKRQQIITVFFQTSGRLGVFRFIVTFSLNIGHLKSGIGNMFEIISGYLLSVYNWRYITQ